LVDALERAQKCVQPRRQAQMNFKERLSLVSEGYTPDAVGLLTSLLNLHFKIDEETVRKILRPLLEAKPPFIGIIQNDPKMLRKEKGAVLRMMNKLVEGGTQRPDFADIVYFLKNALVFSGIKPTPLYVTNLAKYIFNEWEDLLLYVDISPQGKTDQNLINKLAGGEGKEVAAVQWLGTNKQEAIGVLDLPNDFDFNNVAVGQWLVRELDGTLKVYDAKNFKR